jgi:hypothetical protein
MIATPDRRNRLMQELRAETWVRRKSGTFTRERNGRNESAVKRRDVFWGLCPQTPGIYRFDANPS